MLVLVEITNILYGRSLQTFHQLIAIFPILGQYTFHGEISVRVNENFLNKLRKGERDSPIAQNTIFGWILFVNAINLQSHNNSFNNAF